MLETHRQSIMWQQTWLFDYCTRWHAAQHAIRFECHFLSHLQIITINLVLSPLPVCRWIASIGRNLLLKKKLLMSSIENWIWDINKRKSRWSDIYNGRTKKLENPQKMFLLRNKKSKNIAYCKYCPDRLHIIRHCEYEDGWNWSSDEDGLMILVH